MPLPAPHRPFQAAVTSLTAALSFAIMLAFGGCGGQDHSPRISPASNVLILPGDVDADACAADDPLAPDTLRTGASLQERP